jgi:signal transduction histidine kinase
MRRAGWLVQDEAWFPRAVGVATVIVVLLCAVATADSGDRIEVLAGGTVTVAGMAARLRFPGLPIPALLAWTYLPVVVLLARDRNEGLMFVLLLAVMFVQTAGASPGWRAAAGLTATAVPLGVHLLPHMQLDGWPFWTGGLLLTWYSVEQSLRFQALVEELERTRDQLAVQAVQLERRRIAADLHDVVGHSLGIMLLH